MRNRDRKLATCLAVTAVVTLLADHSRADWTNTIGAEDVPPGDVILADYASTDSTPKKDLGMLYHVLENFRLLVKAGDALPLGSNQELVEALTGKNAYKLKFLSPRHPFIDAQGRIIDRWGSPVFFHALSRDRIEIRSAGPDGVMWNEDDLHRNPNGTFRDPEALLSPRLYPP